MSDDKTPMRNRVLRCDDELWDEAQRIAAERGEKLSAVIRFALRRYVKQHAR